MEELKLGPNGGLVYCMEYLEDNLDDWLSEQLEDYIDDDYLIFDCPGWLRWFPVPKSQFPSSNALNGVQNKTHLWTCAFSCR